MHICVYSCGCGYCLRHNISFVIFDCSIRVYCSLSILLEGYRKHLEGPEYNIVLVISLLGTNENWLSLYLTTTHLGYVNDFKCSVRVNYNYYLFKEIM